MIGALNYINLFCHDIDQVFEFYRRLFALEEIVESRTPLFRGARTGGCSIGFSTSDVYPLLALRPPIDAAGDTSFPTFDVTSRLLVDRLTASAASLGASIVKPPFTTYYGWYQAVLRDPEGHPFRINHPG